MRNAGESRGGAVREAAGAVLGGGESLGRQWRACQAGVAACNFQE